MNKQEVQDLIIRYNNGTASAEEKAWLENWYLHESGRQFLDENELPHPDQGDRLWLGTLERAGLNKHHTTRRLWPRIAAAAAAILIGITIGGYLLLKQPKTQQLAKSDPEKISPLTTGVVLTLSNGQRIPLNHGHRGRITSGSTTTIDQQDSLLTYRPGYTAAEAVETNTVTNNSGRKFSLRLADGTEAILDVRSTLTYPVAFLGKTREVSALGQVYFKVKHNDKQPFLVKVEGELIEDIGTEFNVNAYENARTTLVEGAVKVNEHLLKPGQMAVAETNEKIVVSEVNITEVTAWLQDRIIYKETSLETIMKEVARIYQVKVIWQDDLRKRTFGVILSRKKPLSNVLNYFRETGNVDFKVEGKTVTVFKPKNK